MKTTVCIFLIGIFLAFWKKLEEYIARSDSFDDQKSKEPLKKKVVSGEIETHWEERRRRFCEILSAPEYQRPVLFDRFCEKYRITRFELTELLELLAGMRSKIGELHKRIFQKIKKGKSLSSHECQKIFELYAAYLVGEEIDPLVYFFMETTLGHLYQDLYQEKQQAP